MVNTKFFFFSLSLSPLWKVVRFLVFWRAMVCFFDLPSFSIWHRSLVVINDGINWALEKFGEVWFKIQVADSWTVKLEEFLDILVQFSVYILYWWTCLIQWNVHDLPWVNQERAKQKCFPFIVLFPGFIACWILRKYKTIKSWTQSHKM